LKAAGKLHQALPRFGVKATAYGFRVGIDFNRLNQRNDEMGREDFRRELMNAAANQRQ
jgi:hypothetical protein